MRHSTNTLALCLAISLAVAPVGAVLPPTGSPADALAFKVPALSIATEYEPIASLEAGLAASLAADLAALGVDPAGALYDVRSGRWVTLLQATPLIPGRGNALEWGSEAPESDDEIGAAAREAFLGYLDAYSAELRIDRAEIERDLRVTVHDNGRLVQISAPRRVGGVQVRDTYLTAVINSGNLVLFGARNWSDIKLATTPTLSADAALATVLEHVGSLPVDRSWRKPHLVLLPLASDSLAGIPGSGIDFRLAWSLSPGFAGDFGSWEALVDAHGGELLAFEDTNHYATVRNVYGGVMPISNDELTPDGQEQAAWPMPFADLTDTAGNKYVTDSGGNSPVCIDGDITTHLDSQYVRMIDRCEPTGNTTSVSSNTLLLMDDIDLGIAPPGGTDCTPSTNPALGNTRASRSGFYEVNRIMEQARGQLPGNLWLEDQLTANMNIGANETTDPTSPAICNAFWNGSTINFYRSSGACANTGEIAGIFDHEWGHGMDNFDATGFIARPGQEGIADAYMALRLNTSCVGRNFSSALGCNGPQGGNGDPCINNCNGVRETDYHNRLSGLPHNIAFLLSNCGSQSPTCGGAVHCEGAIVSEMIWDLAKRDLRCQGSGWVDDGPPFDGPVGGGECDGGAPASIDEHTALELATRLTYQGGGMAGRWFECRVNGLAGCIADGAYLNYLAADDDDGNLANGTPHMEAIFAAFDRHDMACDAMPQPILDSGCSGAPTQAPVVTAAALDRAVRLTWPTVANATGYEVFRAEGLFQCDAGKTKVGTVDAALCAGGTCEFVAEGLQNGFEYYFKVLPLGGSDGPANTCTGPMSAECTTVTPNLGPNLGVDGATATLEMLTGDGDIFLDNCEEARVTFDVFNTGDGDLTNVRIVDVRPVDLPGFSVSTSFPASVAATLSSCLSEPGSFELTATGLAFQDSFAFQVELTSDELAALGLTRTFLVGFDGLGEGDFQAFTSKVFSYESGLDDWIVERGTFDRTDNPPGAGNPGGANGTSFLVASSSELPGQCDKIRTPLLKLSATSTLSLQNQWDIEGDGGTGTWYDRANVRLVDVASGAETFLVPSGGSHPYNVPDGAANGTCDMASQPGWAATSANFGTAAGWGDAIFDSAALGAGLIAGDVVRLGINYGTDPGSHLLGFWFDEVEITDFELHVPDVQGCDINLPPNAVDDAVGTTVDTAVVISVLANDDDPEGAPISISAVQGVTDQGGTAVDNGDGTITYTPPLGFQSPPIDTFTYEITDGVGFATATVSVSVAFFNNPPTAVDDAATTTQGLAIEIDVLANDSDLDGQPLAIDQVNSPTAQGGTASINDNGTPGDSTDDFIDYTPPVGFFSGPADTFTYVISDGFDLAQATVSVTVEPACPPTATGAFADDVETEVAGYVIESTRDQAWEHFSPDTTATSADTVWQALDLQPGTPASTSNDNRLQLPAMDLSTASRLSFWHNFDFARFTASTEATSYQSGGVLEISNDGGLTWRDLGNYMTGGGYNGIMDADASNNTNPIRGREAWVGTSSPTTPGDPRVGPNGRLGAMFRTQVDLGAAIQTEFASSEVLGALVRFRLGGTFQILLGGQQGTGWGVDDITVNGLLEQGNCAPFAIDDSASTPYETAVTIDVLANDSDPNGDPLTVDSVGTPGNGMAIDNGDGTVTYTPNAGFSGVDTFTYTICDPSDLCDTATVTVSVGASDNLPPDAVEDGASTAFETAVTIDVLANDSDPDNDPIAIGSVQTPTDQGGTAVENAGMVTYTPAAGFSGVDTFTYTICDDGTPPLCDTATVTVTVGDSPNRAPVAEDDSASTAFETAVAIDVLANDSDPDNDPLVVGSVTQGANGSVANNGSAVTYTPNAGFFGIDTFTYEACDDGSPALCDAATVTMTVGDSPNRAPYAEDDSASTAFETAVAIDVLANDSDPDGDPISVNAVNQGANGSVTNNGTDVTYTPNAGFSGTDSFLYEVCDDGSPALCDTATVTVTVRPAVDPCSGDDDDFDSDGKRNDVDSDDDNDGIPDDLDSDDDNDGDSDNSDSDDDNDCIDDDFDSDGSREEQSRSSSNLAPGAEQAYTLNVGTLTTWLVARAEGTFADNLVIEIADPSGNPVATSVSTPGQALAVAIPALAGDYLVTVKNPAATSVSFDLTQIRRQPW